MNDRKSYVLISGYKDISFSNKIEAEFVEQGNFFSKNPNDYDLIFIRDLNELNSGTLRYFLNSVSQAKLLLFVPSQIKLRDPLGTDFFNVHYSKGIHPIITGASWLSKEFQNISSNIALSYETEFTLSQIIDAQISLANQLNKLEKKSGDELFNVVASNPSGRVVSFIFRSYGNSKLIVYPFMEGPEEKLKELIKRIIESAIIKEIGFNIGKETPKWIENVFPDKRSKLYDLAKEYQVVSDFIKMAQGLYYQSGEELEKTVGKVLQYMDVKVEFVGQEREQMDLIIEFSNGKRIITEVKGLYGQADFRHISTFLAGNPSAKELCFVVNNDLDVSIPEREDISSYPPFHPLAIKKIKEHIENGKIKEFYPLSTVELAKWASEGIKDLDLLKRMEEYKDKIMGKSTQVTGNPLSKPISVSHLPKYAKEEKNEGS